MLVTVVPTFPGLINSINPAIDVGYVNRLFDISWMYGVGPSFVPAWLKLQMCS